MDTATNTPPIFPNTLENACVLRATPVRPEFNTPDARIHKAVTVQPTMVSANT